MGTIVTTDIANGQVTDAAVMNNNFGAVKAVVNGGLDNSNLVGNAAIAPSKLAAGTNGQVLTTVAGAAAWADATAGAVPAGAMLPYGGTAAPATWLLCDGANVSRTTYATLFAAIGTAYGTGDGSTTFGLPDMRGRVAVGKGTNTSVDTLGESDGVAEANRRPQHRHTPHTHVVGGTNSVGGAQLQGPQTANNSAFTSAAHDGGSGNANDSLDAPAYLVMNFIIKT